MSRFERCLLYGMSVVVLAGAVASQFGLGRGRQIGSPIYAADCHDNHTLDVLRRGIHYSRDTAVGELDRGTRLERCPVSFDEMQRVISFAYKAYLDDRTRAMKLDKSSAPGDRTLAKEAYARSNDWNRIELTLRAMYAAEIQQIGKEAKENRSRAVKAFERAKEWRELERTLTYAFAREADRLQKETPQVDRAASP